VIPVCSYLRVSTKTQIRKGQGIRVQKEKIKEYCMNNNMDLIRIYEDRGISGDKLEMIAPDSFN
jgi:DNA invertase Pin-like site-specific DNA recombinase